MNDNPYADLIPKHPPAALGDPVVYDTMYYVYGWLVFFGVLAVLIILLIVGVKIALKLIYWTAFAVTQGAHNGWNEPAPRSFSEAFKAAAMNQWKAGAKRRTTR